MEGSFLNVTSVERFSTERRAGGREGEAGGTGERRRIADGAGLQRDQREWVPKHRKKGLDEGREDTSPTQTGGMGKKEAPGEECTKAGGSWSLDFISVWRQGRLLGRCSGGGFEEKDGEWNSREGARNRGQVRMEHVENGAQGSSEPGDQEPIGIQVPAVV